MDLRMRRKESQVCLIICEHLQRTNCLVEAQHKPDMIPLEVTGVIDSDMSRLSANEIMMWALSNLWQKGQEGGYTVHHGRQPVRDFPDHHIGNEADPNRINFFEKAFPCLFPYGFDGIEADREVTVAFAEHIRWALQYHDRCFRKHETFPFVAFDIAQHRQALTSAQIQMSHNNFEKDAHVMSSITLSMLQQAQREEEMHIPISSPAVRLLRKNIHGSSVMIAFFHLI